ncbi:MAG: 50S ribosomal protein L25, partial [Anaerolineaceae bacterium]|nr:50S ribosomal protein L25 [Anaerolineaceae bacterium]
MDKLELNATKRKELGKKVGRLRRAGKLPGVIYGRHIESQAITMDKREATPLLGRITSSSIVNVIVDGETIPCLIRERQRDYIKREFTHIDFQAVSMKEIIRTMVNIEVVGLSPAIKLFSGVLVTGLNQIEIECLPGDLPEKIIVDSSVLGKIGDGLYVKDISLSDKISILSNPEEMIILIT